MSNVHNYVVVVAGGSGTRLWPLSRKNLPKQVHKLISDKTLIEETVDRAATVVPRDHIFISTTKNYADTICDILPDIPKDNIIVEPVSRGTPAAFALLSEYIYRRDPDATVISLASDHAISELPVFQKALEDTFDYVNGNPKSIALIGITPTKPDTGLGYIKIDRKIQDNPTIFSVEKFVEKPTKYVAEKYIKSGEYFWNAAYYCFKAATLLEAYEEADPELTAQTRKYLESNIARDYELAPIRPQEIELVNAKRFPLVVLPVKFGWSDIGSWGTLHDIMSDIEKAGNADVKVNDLHVDIDSTNTMVMVNDEKKLVATVGLKDIIIVETKDALLVLNKNRSQDIKMAIEELKSRGLEEYL